MITEVGASPYAVPGPEVADALGVTPGEGLSAAEAEERQTRHGPNSLPQEPPPGLWSVIRGQVSDPMNIMLLAVAIASIAIGQGSTGILVGALVALNVGLGANQERKAQASVEALARCRSPRRGCSATAAWPTSPPSTWCPATS